MKYTTLCLCLAALAACRRDESCPAETISWADRDGDGFGDPGTQTSACTIPAGSVDNDRDCDDASADVRPGAAEVCDGIDNDCDGKVDPDPTTWFVDADGDGYGTSAATAAGCAPPAGYAATDDDCDDRDADAHPGGTDRCGDGIDGDCVGGDSPCVFTGELALADADSKTYSVGSNEEFGRVLDAGDVNGDGEIDVLGGAQYMNDYLGGGYILYGPLDGTHVATDVGYRLENTTTEPRDCGRSVSVGDINRDGYDDMALGGYDGLRVEFGPIESDVDLAEADVYAFGNTNSTFGHGNDLADVNDDGDADLVVGAHTDDTGAFRAGVLYVVFGPLDGGDRNVPDDHDLALVDSTESQQAGRTVKVGGDFNADGAEDVMLEAAGYSADGTNTDFGAAFVLFGPLDSDRPLDEPDAILVADVPGSYAGQAMSQADADGDGVTDAAVGAPGMAPDGVVFGGCAYVVRGPFSGIVELNSSADFTVCGDVTYARTGTGVALGDVTGDSLADIVVGAPMTAETVPGGAYYFEAPLSGTASLDDAQAVFSGEELGDSAGTGVLLVDLDHNGATDFVISSPYDATSGNQGGAIYTYVAH